MSGRREIPPGAASHVYHAQLGPILWGSVPLKCLLWLMVVGALFTLGMIAFQVAWIYFLLLALVLAGAYGAAVLVTRWDPHGLEIYVRWWLYAGHYGES